ncbi:hypothetical protein CEXT_675381 [Caerostris extrusa]|uniref:Uncharacterized protein n=1 Tax=Caerostris extrusa TaxID=172846 RepID=A0AAV4SVJ9_CAEEX|nr:hypothetical protein CEXT_675381 [Caerostris extrusa]
MPYKVTYSEMKVIERDWDILRESFAIAKKYTMKVEVPCTELAYVKAYCQSVPRAQISLNSSQNDLSEFVPSHFSMNNLEVGIHELRNFSNPTDRHSDL